MRSGAHILTYQLRSAKTSQPRSFCTSIVSWYRTGKYRNSLARFIISRVRTAGAHLAKRRSTVRCSMLVGAMEMRTLGLQCALGIAVKNIQKRSLLCKSTAGSFVRGLNLCKKTGCTRRRTFIFSRRERKSRNQLSELWRGCSTARTKKKRKKKKKENTKKKGGGPKKDG